MHRTFGNAPGTWEFLSLMFWELGLLREFGSSCNLGMHGNSRANRNFGNVLEFRDALEFGNSLGFGNWNLGIHWNLGMHRNFGKCSGIWGFLIWGSFGNWERSRNLGIRGNPGTGQNLGIQEFWARWNSGNSERAPPPLCQWITPENLGIVPDLCPVPGMSGDDSRDLFSGTEVKKKKKGN